MLVHKGTSLISLSPIKHYIQNTFILAEKLVLLLRGIDMHYNTGRLKPSPRLETGNYFFRFLRFISSVFYAIIVKITSCLSSIFFQIQILERVLHQQLYGYMTEPNLLTAKQFVSFYGQSSKET